MFVALLVWNKKKEGKFFGSATGDPYGITNYLKDTKDEKAYLTKTNMMCAIYPENYEQKPPKKEMKENSDGEEPPKEDTGEDK